MNAVKRSAVIGGMRYNVEKADLICDDAWWDGHSWEQRGRNKFLYRTEKGNYFFQIRLRYQGEPCARLEACSQDEAIAFFEELQQNNETRLYCEFHDAFPGVSIEEA